MGPHYLPSPFQISACTVVSKQVKKPKKGNDELAAQEDERNMPSEVKEEGLEMIIDSDTS